MLRHVVTAVAVVFAAGALVGFVVEPASFPVMLTAGVLLLGTLFEGWRYRARRADAIAGAWRASGERFVDTDTGRVLAVETDAATGARRYRDAGEATVDP